MYLWFWRIRKIILCHLAFWKADVSLNKKEKLLWGSNKTPKGSLLKAIQPHKDHLTSILNSKTVPVLPALVPSLIFPIHLLPNGFSFCFFPGFLAIFIMFSSNNNRSNSNNPLPSDKKARNKVFISRLPWRSNTAGSQTINTTTIREIFSRDERLKPLSITGPNLGGPPETPQSSQHYMISRRLRGPPIGLPLWR